MTVTARLLAALAAVLTICGCVHAAPGSDLDTPYKEAVDRWTATADLYQHGDKRARFAATFESRVFRELRNRKQAEQLGWSSEVEQAELKKQLEEADTETSFVVEAYTDFLNENNLGDKRSIWRVALRSATGELLPTKIEKIGRTNENLLALYPYMDNHYSRLYRIHFPKVEVAPMTLQVDSAVGHANLTFERM